MNTVLIAIQVAVEAEVVGGHLAIHRHHLRDDLWVVTHVPTGYALCWANSESDARAIVEAALPMWDWSFATPDGRPRCRDVKRIAGRCVPLGAFRADGPLDLYQGT